MSTGYFDLVPNSMGDTFLSMEVDLSIDFSRLSKQMVNKLAKAVNTGILPSYSGKLAAIYRTIAHGFNWDTPHLWTQSSYIGCRFYVTKGEWETRIAPFLAVLAPENMGPRYYPVGDWYSRSNSGYGTLQKVDKMKYANRQMKYATPEILEATVKELDKRDQGQVDQVLDLIHAGKTLTLSKRIS